MMNLKVISHLKKFMEGKSTVDELIKTFLPIQAKLNVNIERIDPLLTTLGIKDSEFTVRLTTVTFEGKEWLALLLIEKTSS